MRTISYTAKFKKDYKRVRKSKYAAKLDKNLEVAFALLASDKNLPMRYYDHALTGSWNDHRDCHILPDLVLIYRKPNKKTLELVRLGSHSQLSL